MNKMDAQLIERITAAHSAMVEKVKGNNIAQMYTLYAEVGRLFPKMINGEWVIVEITAVDETFTNENGAEKTWIEIAVPPLTPTTLAMAMDNYASVD